MPHGQWGALPASADALRGVKENLVLVDDEGTEDVVGRLEALRGRWPDLRVVVLKGFSREELKDLFLRAKVVIDAGMRGMERITMECLQFFVVPLHVRVCFFFAFRAPRSVAVLSHAPPPHTPPAPCAPPPHTSPEQASPLACRLRASCRSTAARSAGRARCGASRRASRT